jgi:hypothetical protein
MVKDSKKGAIEMSLNLIIMLIIGMVVLGLVIGFVNSLVGKGTESFNKQLGDNEKLKLEEVKNSQDNLAVSPLPSITIKKGSTANIFIKVRAFADDIDCSPGDLNNCQQVNYVLEDDSGETQGLLLSGPGFHAKQGSEDAQMYTLKFDPDNDISVGTYYLTIKLYPDTDNEESKTLTVEVK